MVPLIPGRSRHEHPGAGPATGDAVARRVHLGARPCARPRHRFTTGCRPYLRAERSGYGADHLHRQRRSDKDAATDAGGSVSALRDWPLLQHGKSPDAIRSPVERYRLRNANPPADAEVKELRVDFRKYLDLYHGSELEAPARRIVIHPGLIYRHDSPSHAAPK
ncbi:T6SS amidase immunity protein Tai4 family protein [Ralstonia solanacearum]|uniref:T6SS amidase immunity protein Tai4 family protein n=1 Tax=Ralstonia solanacearum TaxID=305 RepID=UPI0035E62EF7